MMTSKFFLKITVPTFLVISTFSSCLEDSLFQNENTEIKLRYLSGPLAGLEFDLNTGADTEGDLRFIPSKNITRLFCQPLIENLNNRLQNSSSINFAWDGIPSSGEKLAINANNANEQWAGDIDLNFVNGDFITTSIPKNTKIQITEYPSAGEQVTGSINFSAFTNYNWNGQQSQQIIGVNIDFKIIRSVDGQ